MECPRCGRLPGNGHTEICALQGEIERLLHDIERHIAIASDLATENERLRAELAERGGPDCRSCYWLGEISRACLRPGGGKACGGYGIRYVSQPPVRLYEIDAAMAGGE